MNETLTTLNARDEAIRRLAQGFSSDFAEFCAGDDAMHEVMMNLADRFIEMNIPITDEEASSDLAFELIMNVTVTKV